MSTELEIVSLAYLGCSMIATTIFAYRDGMREDQGPQSMALVFAAPLALAYQIGRVIRENKS